MSFFKKRWVAVIICILLIVAALSIGRRTDYQPESAVSASDWGKENYEGYTRYVHDETGLLSSSTVRTVSRYNAAADYSYGSICGLWIAGEWKLGEDETVDDAAYEYSLALGLGDDDFLLILIEENEDWYFYYGANASYYINNELEVLVKGAVNKAFSKPDKAIEDFYEELADWYEEELPVADQRHEGGNVLSVVGGSALFILLIGLLIVVAVISSLVRVGRRCFGGWGPTIFVGRPWHHHHRPPHGPGPRPGPDPRPGPRPSGGHRPSGGFGGSRGGGSRGGFGGGSRGSSGRGGGFGGGRR